MNIAKKIGSGALFGIILGMFFVVLMINVTELTSIINAKAKTLTDLEAEFLNLRMEPTYNRTRQAILTISVIVVIATTPILPFLERKILGQASNLGLEGELCSNSMSLGRSALFILIAILPSVLVNGIIIAKNSIFLWIFNFYSIFIFLISAICFLRKRPTCGRFLASMGILFCLKLIFRSIIQLVSIKVILSKLILPNTESFDSLVQEFTKFIGSNRKFDNIYFIDGQIPYPAFAAGIFEFNNIYVQPIMGKLSKDILFGVLSHEAGHCYHSHITKRIFIETFLFSVLLVIAGWFIIKSKFTERLINGNILFSRNQGDKLKKPSIAMKLAVFMLTIYPAFQQVSEISLNILHRHNEIQADEFAVGIGHGKGLHDFLQILNLPNACSDNKIYSIMYELHPHFEKRTNHIKNIMKNSELLNSKSVFIYPRPGSVQHFGHEDKMPPSPSDMEFLEWQVFRTG